MSSSILQEAKQLLDGVLKPEGFLRRNSTYNRSLPGGIVDVLHLQLGIQHQEQVAINLGVHLRRSAAMLGENSAEWINLSDCQLRVRLNAISECDEWISFENAADTKERLTFCIRQFAVAFWQQLSSDDAILRHWRNQTFPPVDLVNKSAIAALMVDCGDLAGATDILREMRQWRFDNGLSTNVTDEDARKLGIVLT